MTRAGVNALSDSPRYAYTGRVELLWFATKVFATFCPYLNHHFTPLLAPTVPAAPSPLSHVACPLAHLLLLAHAPLPPPLCPALLPARSFSPSPPPLICLSSFLPLLSSCLILSPLRSSAQVVLLSIAFTLSRHLEAHPFQAHTINMLRGGVYCAGPPPSPPSSFPRPTPPDAVL